MLPHEIGDTKISCNLVNVDIEFEGIFVAKEIPNTFKMNLQSRYVDALIEGLGDEDYDEIIADRYSCIEFRFCSGNWYILSSDGLKNS